MHSKDQFYHLIYNVWYDPPFLWAQSSLRFSSIIPQWTVSCMASANQSCLIQRYLSWDAWNMTGFLWRRLWTLKPASEAGIHKDLGISFPFCKQDERFALRVSATVQVCWVITMWWAAQSKCIIQFLSFSLYITYLTECALLFSMKKHHNRIVLDLRIDAILEEKHCSNFRMADSQVFWFWECCSLDSSLTIRHQNNNVIGQPFPFAVKK